MKVKDLKFKNIGTNCDEIIEYRHYIKDFCNNEMQVYIRCQRNKRKKEKYGYRLIIEKKLFDDYYETKMQLGVLPSTKLSDVIDMVNFYFERFNNDKTM